MSDRFEIIKPSGTTRITVGNKDYVVPFGYNAQRQYGPDVFGAMHVAGYEIGGDLKTVDARVVEAGLGYAMLDILIQHSQALAMQNGWHQQQAMLKKQVLALA